MTPTDDNTMPELPRSFLEEIKAVFGDVAEDFSRSILEIDSEVHTFYRAHDLPDVLGPRPEPDRRRFRHDVEGLDLISDASISRFIQDELDKELDQ